MPLNHEDFENQNLVYLKINGNTALSLPLLGQLSDALNQVEDLAETGVLFVHVCGDEASTLQHDWPSNVNVQIVNKWERLLRRMERTTAGLLVLAEKSCSTVGLDLLLVADHRLTGSDLRVHLGGGRAPLWPGMSLYRLVHQIGYTRARRLVLANTVLTAESILNLDIADEIVNVPYSNLAEVIRSKYSTLDDFSLRRRLLQDSLSTSFDDALGAHLAACDRELRNTRLRESTHSALSDPAAHTSQDIGS